MKFPLVLCVLLVLSTLTQADIAEVVDGTERSAAEVHARLTAPRVTIVLTTNEVQKLEAVVAYEAACLAVLTDALDAATGSRNNALARIRSGTALQTVDAFNSSFAAAPGAQKLEALKRMANAQMVLRELDQRGYPFPLPSDFGQPTRTEIVRTPTPRPSIWEERFPNQPPPSVDQVRARLATRPTPAN